MIVGDVDCGWLFVWWVVFGWDGRWVLVWCVRAVARNGLPSVAAGPGWGSFVWSAAWRGGPVLGPRGSGAVRVIVW